MGLTELCRISPAGAQHLQALSKAGEFQSQTCKMSDLRVAASESAVPQGALLKKSVSISDLCLPICEPNLVGILRMSNITHILQEQLLTCPHGL